MKLVIEIDKKAFDYIMACSFVEDEAVMLNQSLEDRIKTLMFFDVLNAIKSGTPLPKGHGDLIDRNDYDKRLESIWKFYHGDETIHDTVDDFDLRFADGVSRAREALNDAPTIIGADGGGEDG